MRSWIKDFKSRQIQCDVVRHKESELQSEQKHFTTRPDDNRTALFSKPRNKRSLGHFLFYYSLTTSAEVGLLL